MPVITSTHALKKGAKAPDFNLVGTDDEFYTLSSLAGERAYLIVFMCNHCPYVKAKLSELNRITRDYKSHGLVVIGINPNDAIAYPEDSFDSMKSFVDSGQIQFLYLLDESQDVARAYGAACTPDAFLFDADFKLVFHSRIDDPPTTGPAKRHELHEAIGEFLEHGRISIPESPSRGCSIKWK